MNLIATTRDLLLDVLLDRNVMKYGTTFRSNYKKNGGNGKKVC